MKTVLVLADAACVHMDVTAALKIFKPDTLAFINCIGIEWCEAGAYWFTLHPQKAGPWPGMEEAMRRRLLNGFNQPETWGHKPNKGIDKSTSDWGGSSGLFAVKALMEEGYTHIVAAGMPMESIHAHYYEEKKPWQHAERYHKGWLKHKQDIAHCFRSMRGWTRATFGEPTKEWFAS